MYYNRAIKVIKTNHVSKDTKWRRFYGNGAWQVWCNRSGRWHTSPRRCAGCGKYLGREKIWETRIGYGDFSGVNFLEYHHEKCLHHPNLQKKMNRALDEWERRKNEEEI